MGNGDRKECDVGFRIGGRHGGGELLERFGVGGLAEKGLGRLCDAAGHFGALELYADNRGCLVGVRRDTSDSIFYVGGSARNAKALFGVPGIQVVIGRLDGFSRMSQI